MVGRSSVLETMMIRFPIRGKIREPVKKATEDPIALRDRFASMVHVPKATIRSMKINANNCLTSVPPSFRYQLIPLYGLLSIIAEFDRKYKEKQAK